MGALQTLSEGLYMRFFTQFLLYHSSSAEGCTDTCRYQHRCPHCARTESPAAENHRLDSIKKMLPNKEMLLSMI